MIDLMQSMNPVLHVALLFTLFCYALAVCMALWRLLHGPSAQDRILALDYIYMVAMLAILALSVRTMRPMCFEAALLIERTGFVSSAALAKFLLRGEVIE